MRLTAHIDEAYEWVCKQRHHHPPNADIWHLRFHWDREKYRLIQELDNNTYRFDPLEVVTKANGDTLHLWSARDALVLKCLALLLARYLPLSSHCTHVKGHGGLKATVADVQRHLTHYRFVLRTDVKDYYENIDHWILLEQLSRHIRDRFMLNLLGQYLRRTVHRGGLYKDITRGISRGCPLSPVIGAFYLKALDDELGNSGLYYVRYMDDVLVMAPTRWKLRRGIKRLNRIFQEFSLAKHPDKTFIGRIEKGFDFLGYHFSRQPLSLAAKTVRNFIARLHRLYEQKKTAPDMAAVLGDYVRRWTRWAVAGGIFSTQPRYPWSATPLDIRVRGTGCPFIRCLGVPPFAKHKTSVATLHGVEALYCCLTRWVFLRFSTK